MRLFFITYIIMYVSNVSLRRHYPHQVKGSKVCPSSQPVSTSSPVFSSRLYYRLHKIAIGLIALRKAFYLPAAHN